MPFKIVRNDITRMQCDAIVNTAAGRPANTFEEVGSGCDKAIHKAAGAEKLIAARKEIGVLAEGKAAITPGFDLPAKYIIHAVSPVYMDGNSGEEEKLRDCYRNSLSIAKEHNLSSIAFPLIATGSFGYPQEEGMRIAVDEINAFLLKNDMMIYLVVFGSKAEMLGERIYPDLEAYIDHNYVHKKREEEYGDAYFGSYHPDESGYNPYVEARSGMESRLQRKKHARDKGSASVTGSVMHSFLKTPAIPVASFGMITDEDNEESPVEFSEAHESKLEERMRHMSDTFSEYLMYLIEEKGKTPVDVYKKAIVDKKVFSKIKNNPDHHPNKMTAMCLCVGAELNLDEARDLLARAGYALSPCDKTDVIFSYFIENRIYDMIELDIQLEEHGLKCLIT
ncbi:MAG: macro domain-containing protein [Lachnospiraceae bacterium]|nr:macro domain-containing protein [Lachnospiraceae bacterium]